MEKSYRIHTNIISDTLLNVNMKQDFDFLEVLSLKLRQKDAYRLHSSNYGVIIGRVLANDAFGIPNAKISVFIEKDGNDPVDIENIYPYSEVTSKDSEGRRYNLLPDYSDDDCYRVVGTFPNKRYLLDDDIQLEVYEKYWKYTTVTNHAGDYMIFGVPAGSQQVHVDIDLSDIGILSQKPRDFTYRGYDLSEFDSPSQFKSSTNLDSLRQIYTQDKSVYVYPFWGDAENGVAAITRCDIQIAYKFEPTCVFMGSIVSDNEANSIGHKCAPSVNNGMNSQLIAGEGTIEMIRKTPDGFVEEYPIQGNALIDSDGVWCYQIPMNLDYVGTDEYGNVVPTDNPSKGLPTRTQVRFRISKTETGDEGFSRHTAKYLVPMNPVTYERNAQVVPMTQDTTGIEIEKMYNFGSSTPQSCFRDLYWNNVYSVKNYIPKVQVAHRPYSANYSALKGANLVEDQNPVPFNKLRIDIPFTYMIVCVIFQIVLFILKVVNTILCVLYEIINTINKVLKIIKKVPLVGKFIPTLDWLLKYLECIPISAGLTEGNDAYYPGCWCCDDGGCGDCPEDMEGDCVKHGDYDTDDLEDKIQQKLAQDFKIVKLDLFQDWINGTLYMPLWYWRKRKKKKFLFITIRRAKNEFCDCDKTYSRLKIYVTCNMSYKDNKLGADNRTIDLNEDRWHKRRARRLWFHNGVIKGVENKDGLTAYYYTAYQANSDDKVDKEILQRTNRFLYVRLYATDIILLGNLNESNLYGIPQLYTALPSTTANIPPIAAIEESLTAEEQSEAPRNDSMDNPEDSGTTITTGMDWGHDGNEQVPRYRKGLFMDLACTYAKTRSKSCINVERLSELGVNPDMTFKMSYSNGGSDIRTGTIDADGFVSKYELDDMDNRAMFATLNHIGFIPQDYQDSISAYTTQVEDENTGYLIPKFKYTYPVDFDGRMELIMQSYKSGFEQATFDEPDKAYVTFRLGAEEEKDYTKNPEERIRHFYFNENGRYDMPLYNNSFYFYFGINKGSTAIDKFNKMFYAPCFQNVRKPFTLDYSFAGRSYCPYVYENPCDGTTLPEEAYKGYGYIRVTLDDIQIPYSYKLYDSTGALVIEEYGMEDRDFAIGAEVNVNGNIVPNSNGEIKYHVGDLLGQTIDTVTGPNYLTNQEYTLVVTDVNKKSMSERIKLEMPKLSIEYESESLGTKFYDTGTTREDYICTDETDFYGKLRVLTYNVDNNLYYITGYTVIGYSDSERVYKIQLDGVHISEGYKLCTTVIVRLGILDVSDAKTVKDCLCDTTNRAAPVNGQKMYIQTAAQNPYWIRFETQEVDPGDGSTLRVIHPTYLVYQPNRFTLTISQMCKGEELEDNKTSEIVNVNNGKNFNAFVGANGTEKDMPVRFMLGSVNDSSVATIGVTSNFYRLDAVTNPVGEGLKGWYGLHEEDTYRFQKADHLVILKNSRTWDDFVVLNEPINTHAAKANILAYKFNAMFSLSEASYVINEYSSIFYSTRGGIAPILYRMVAPMYGDYTKFDSTYVLNDRNRSTMIANYPMIVGKNSHQDICDKDLNGPQFSKKYKRDADRERVGNYFAAFTHNGGYTSKTKVDDTIHVMKIPNYTKVTPMNTTVEKSIGKDVIGSLVSKFEPAYKAVTSSGRKYNPYLRTLFVDRRFDYRLVLFAPSLSNSIQVYPKAKCKMEKIWKSGRISGYTYNGIEMSYDEEYNVISAHTIIQTDQDENEYNLVTAATANKRLEYSYNFSDNDPEDARTYYNHEPPENVVWEGDDNNESHQIVKRFYTAIFSGFDIRNYFWSSFNRLRLKSYSDPMDLRENVPYIYKYPREAAYDGVLYNGDFNMNEVSRNYPTRRYIDVGNIPPSDELGLEIESCAYGLRAYKDGDGSVKATCESEKGLIFQDFYENPIEFVEPNAGNNDYGNVMFTNTLTTECGYVKFRASGIKLYFKFTQKSIDGFKTYTGMPRIVRVLDYIYDPSSKYEYIDGLSYMKTSVYDKNPDELFAQHSDLKHLFENAPCVLYTFGQVINVLWLKFNRDIVAPSGVNIGRLRLHDGTEDWDTYLEKENETLTSDHNDFLNTTFQLESTLEANNKILLFTLLFHREHISDEDDFLERRLSVVEHGDIYDTRPLLLRVVKTDPEDVDNNGNIIPHTYVEKIRMAPGSISGAAYDIQGDTTGSTVVPGPGGSGTTTGSSSGHMDDGYGKVSGDTNIFTYIQVITFDMHFHYKKVPLERQNEAFADYDMMRYIFRFKNLIGDQYDLEPSEIRVSPPQDVADPDCTHLTLHFKIRWTQDMGILHDKVWKDNNLVTIFAKTHENFCYKINSFKLIVPEGGQEGGYDSTTKTDTGMAITEPGSTTIVPNYTCAYIEGQSGCNAIPCTNTFCEDECEA